MCGEGFPLSLQAACLSGHTTEAPAPSLLDADPLGGLVDTFGGLLGHDWVTPGLSVG